MVTSKSALVHPIVIEITAFGATRPIGGYGLAVAIGVLVSAALAARAARRIRADVGAVIAAIGYTTMASFAGAFALFWLVTAVQTGDPLAIRSGGGLVFYGAVPTGLLASYVAARGFELPWLRLLDLSIPGIAAGHALGRVGCFLGGCCYGLPWDGPLAVTATHELAPAAHPPVPRHPVQLYEAVGLMALAFAFAVVPARRIGDGGRALVYVALYAVLRFAVELLRGDALRGVWMLGASTSQLVSIASFCVALVLAVRVWRARRAPPAPSTASEPEAAA